MKDYKQIYYVLRSMVLVVVIRCLTPLLYSLSMQILFCIKQSLLYNVYGRRAWLQATVHYSYWLLHEGRCMHGFISDCPFAILRGLDRRFVFFDNYSTMLTEYLNSGSSKIQNIMHDCKQSGITISIGCGMQVFIDRVCVSWSIVIQSVSCLNALFFFYNPREQWPCKPSHHGLLYNVLFIFQSNYCESCIAILVIFIPTLMLTRFSLGLAHWFNILILIATVTVATLYLNDSNRSLT